MSRRKKLRNLPEIWGGVECTVNRVQANYFNQMHFSGHFSRESDLDLFASLGLKTLRYPVLWEMVAPEGLEHADWTWADERLNKLRELGIRPVVGLVHHGSGPPSTNLVSPDFAEGLARFAAAVAQRYPWVDAYTPVNEPLTTARFSGLYGHWYPHGHNEQTFARALLNQVRATQLAMDAIRQINPDAQLIQTEDLGKTYTTPSLDYQADYENTRRWLSLDLLMGRMNPDHGLYHYFDWAGIPEADLRQVADNPCPPQVIGLNYYITSERFLDERLELYPPHLQGGNGQDDYADVEAVRVCPEGVAGQQGLLQEAWERYGLPLALTEVHLGATREDQLRWLMEAWQAALALRQEGVDVQAVTAWALLGSYNWHCMVTRDEGYYEPGVFDTRAPQPRPTVLAEAIRSLAAGHKFAHPVLDAPGWWRRSERLLYAPASRRDEAAYPGAAPARPAMKSMNQAATGPRPLLIVGRNGTLAQAFLRLCAGRGLAVVSTSREELDIRSARQVEEVVGKIKPWAVVNTAGFVRVDAAEAEAEACYALNTAGSVNLAETCARLGLPLVTYSSDLVFNGQKRAPYIESDAPAPLNVYGCSKASAETEVLHRLPEALVIRTSAFFGPWDAHNFATQVWRALDAGHAFIAPDDLCISPTYVPDLVHASLDLLIDGENGIWHLANRGALTWLEFGRRVAEQAGLDEQLVEGRPAAELDFAAQRPAYSALASEKAWLLPPLEDALQRYAAELQAF